MELRHWIVLGIGLLVLGVAVSYLYAPATRPITSITLSLQQSGKLGGVEIIPREVLEDSRCPVDVQCIQAGRVRLRADVNSKEQIFTLGDPGVDSIVLSGVTPPKNSKQQIANSDYRFTFSASQR